MTLWTRRHWLACAAGLAGTSAAASGGAGGAGPGHVRESRRLFGSPCDLILPAGATAPAQAQAQAALAGTWATLQQLNERWNAWKPGELSTLNAAFAAGRAAPASPWLHLLLEQARVLERASLGFFNPCIGGAVQAWGFHDDVMRPGPAPGAQVLARWRQAAPSLAQVSRRGALLHTGNPLLQLDLGAVAKGFAIDRVLDTLQRQGLPAALVNLGGNLAVVGPASARAWTIGLRDPFSDGLMATLATRGREAVVTSGTYERLRLAGGQQVTHVIDPFQARPAMALTSVTVLHASAAVADAAATALLVAGPGRWRALAGRMGLDQVLSVDREGRMAATRRLAPRLRLEGNWTRAPIAIE